MSRAPTAPKRDTDYPACAGLTPTEGRFLSVAEGYLALAEGALASTPFTWADEVRVAIAAQRRRIAEVLCNDVAMGHLTNKEV